MWPLIIGNRRGFLKWLYPGLRIKRWLFILVAGIMIFSLGLAYVMAHLYRTQPFPPIVYYLTLQFIDRPYRGVLFVLLGALSAIIAFRGLSKSMLDTFVTGEKTDWVDAVYRSRRLARGPKIVAIGGGTGLSTLLRGLKEYTSNITAIVTVADDGGSSGRLRRSLGVLPPGDFRQCITALADTESLVGELFEYRFKEGTDLGGHSFGNLFIVAMSEVTGSFERALRESSRVLAVRGQIMPSTLENVTLFAEMDDESTISGESKISESFSPIKRVYLEPAEIKAYPEAVKAILGADMIVIGPGSLYTSVLPNLLVTGISQAIKSSKALRVYVCNVATQRGETDGYTVSDHVQAIQEHVGDGLVHHILANNHLMDMPAQWRVQSVPIDARIIDKSGARVILADIVDENFSTRHSPQKLAHTLMSLLVNRS